MEVHIVVPVVAERVVRVAEVDVLDSLHRAVANAVQVVDEPGGDTLARMDNLAGQLVQPGVDCQVVKQVANLTAAFGAGGGTLTAANPQVTLTGINFGVLANWSINIGATSIVVQFTPVPEPATVLGVAAGVVGLLRLRRKYF